VNAPAPVDDLFRGLTDGVELRDDTAEDTAGALMFGHFSVFDTWYEVESWYEGEFIERVGAGSFRKTIKENRDTLVSQFDHGYDLHVGDSPLGAIEDLREDDVGPYYEVPLYDTDYNRDRILPLLQGRTLDGRTLGSALGSSFRFRVTKDEWVEPSKASAYNPQMLRERTIREVRLYEFGPVVFPANPAATAQARSLSDHFHARRLAKDGRAERAARELLTYVDSAALGTEPSTTVKPALSHSTGSGLDASDVRAFLALSGR
jgi:HK97 family phage prohead protease